MPVSHCTDSQPLSPHTLPPSDLYLAHLAPELHRQEVALDARLQTTESDNTQLLDSILQQRQEIERLVSGLEALVAQIEASNDALPTEDLESFTEDAVHLDAHLTADG